MRPLIVSDNEQAARAAAASLRRDGWTPVGSLPPEPWDLSPQRLLVVGAVKTPAERATFALAASRGAAVVCTAAAAELSLLYDELCRLGPVDLLDSDSSTSTLTLEQRRLLELLASGETLGEAARRLALSRRTADRRLAEARAALGVRSTAEALLALRAGEGTRRGPGPLRS